MNTLRPVTRQLIGLELQRHGIEDDVLEKYVQIGSSADILQSFKHIPIDDDQLRQLVKESLVAVMRPRF